MLNAEQDWCRQILLLGTILLSRDEPEADKNLLLGEESCEITSLPVILKKKVIKNHHVLTLFDLLCVFVEHDR